MSNLWNMLNEYKDIESKYEISREETSRLYNLSMDTDIQIDKEFIKQKLYFDISTLSKLNGITIYNILLVVSDEDTPVPIEFVEGCQIIDGHLLCTSKGEELSWNGKEYEGWLSDDINKAIGWYEVDIKIEDGYETLNWTTRDYLIEQAYKNGES